jgi:drug/metabolite transporter (DMT)-like permease
VSYAYLAAAVLASTLIWPINRAVMRSGGSARLFGFWIATSGALTAAPVAVVGGQVHPAAGLWILGAIIGTAYALGYCTIVMYCLRIGPTGPTVVLNNMGFVWASLAGALWLAPRPVTLNLALGLAGVVGSLVLFGCGLRGDGSERVASARWFAWALAGWVLSGVSMTSQAVCAVWYPNAPFGTVLAFSAAAAALLAPFAPTERRAWISRPETPAGIVGGAVNTVGVAATLAALRELPPQIVFPVAIAGPMVIVQVLAAVALGERPGALGWLACAVGAAGIALLVAG